MSRRLVFRAEAEEEIATAAEWYEARSPGLAAEFLRAFDGAIAAVERAPLQYPEILPNIRRALLRRFPYSIVYRASQEEVVVVACVHWRQQPKRWRNRM